jgi:hypothetical protein
VRGVSFVSVVHSAPTPKSEYHTLVLDILGLCLLFKQLISKSFGTIVTGLTFHMAQYIGFKIIKFSIPISKTESLPFLRGEKSIVPHQSQKSFLFIFFLSSDSDDRFLAA